MCFLTWRTKFTHIHMDKHTHKHTHTVGIWKDISSAGPVFTLTQLTAVTFTTRLWDGDWVFIFCGDMCVISCCLVSSSCVCACFSETGWAGRQLALGVLLLYKQELVSALYKCVDARVCSYTLQLCAVMLCASALSTVSRLLTKSMWLQDYIYKNVISSTVVWGPQMLWKCVSLCSRSFTL